MEEISVIMPVYNCAGQLDLSIGSVLAQRDVQLRLYICDDASTDGSWETIQIWAERDARIECMRNEGNLGATGARNRCLAGARGRLIALMDADDYSHPDRLKTQLAFLRERPELAFAGTRGRFLSRCRGILRRTIGLSAGRNRRIS